MLTLPTILLVSTVHFAPEPDPLWNAALLAPIPVVDEPDRPGFSYTFIEANYIVLDSDAADDNIDGFELKGSLELPLNFFAQLSGSSLSGDADLDQYRIGAGWHFALGKTIDAYGILSYVDQNFSNGIDDENGLTGDVGARLALTPKVEVLGFAEWADVESSEVGVGAGGRFYVTERLSLGLQALFIDTGDEWTAGARFQF
jgi:hypothetical protein